MKSSSVVILVLVFIAVAVSVHIYKINSMVNNIESLSERAIEEFEKENWDEVLNSVNEIESVWSKNRMWVCSTMSTKDIDEIEISLKQSIEYARIRDREDFIGEFNMFKLCIEHIIMQEGISLYELL